MVERTTGRNPLWPEVLILLLGFGLLMARLPGQSVWVDELFTIDAISEPGPIGIPGG